MARIQFKFSAPNTDYFNAFYSAGQPLTIDDHSGRSARFIETSGGADQIILFGENFTYSSNNIVGGVIERIVFSNVSGAGYATISGLNINAKQFDDAAPLSFNALLEAATKGDDLAKGSNDNDFLYSGLGNDRLVGLDGEDEFLGYAGRDRMTGGEGSDVFRFLHNDGRDVITDFDANGGTGNQDFIKTMLEFEIRKSGINTVIDFGEGNMVTLLNVKLSDVDISDFIL
ncbi:calcium-binding protein [Rhizobium sp. LjRoot254]|uniref:calcium-binding protein n=1 Tax=Rhizobium sp. LjRoot254 TaxID=3342297 RepID=UPI003ECFD14F